MVEKLIKQLKEINKDNTISYELGACLKIISTIIILKNNKYVDIFDDYNIDDIKSIFIKHQVTGKTLNFLAKDIKSTSLKNNILRINRYSMKI